MKGTLYGIGVGPGDPELITLKAVKAIGECDIIAAPDAGTDKFTALDIAKEYLQGKPLLPLELPMTRDAQELLKKRETAAGLICRQLDMGKSVGYLTLGDPTVYSTYTYLHKLVAHSGYAAKIIPGVTSFCAAAAALGQPLCESGEPLHIIPALYGGVEDALALPGTKVLMKSGKRLKEALAIIKEKNLSASIAERVGLPGERLVQELVTHEQMQETCDAGYFCIVIARDQTDG